MRCPCCLLLIFAFAAPVHAQPEEELQQQAAAELEAKGLVRLGTAWINQPENQVKQALDAIPAVRHAYYLAEYERWELMLARLLQANKEEQKKLERDLVQARELNAELALAHERMERFSRLARVSKRRKLTNLADPELHRAVRKVINAHNQLATLLLQLEQLTDEHIAQAYVPYLQDAEVGVALRAFGPRARLGPLKRYDNERRKLERVYEEVFSEHVPIVPVDSRFAFWGLANDRVPVELMYQPENTLTLIPEEVIKQLGIKLDPDETPRITVSVENEQQDVFLVRIPSLRIGKHVLRDIEAAVLPGATRGHLGRAALGSYRPTLHPRRLEFELTSVFELDDLLVEPE